MILILLSHQWKAFWRSRSAGKSLVVQFFLGFLILYLLASALVLGFAVRHLLTRLFSGQDIVKIFCGFVLYYFFVDLPIRFMMQELPVLSTQPYLAQNIRRRSLVLFLNIRSLFHFLNLVPILLFVPFAITAIAEAYGPLTTAAFIGSILSLTVFNHFLILYVKRKTIINSWWLAGFLGVVGVLVALDYFHVFSLRNISTLVFTRLLSTPWLFLLALMLAETCFVNNQRFLLNNLYLEEISKTGKQKQSTEYTWLQQLGLTGELISLDIKLILRNKRPKSVLLISLFILLYGFIFYRPMYLDGTHYPMLLLGAFLITGIFIINYGQFLFAWQSGYFDGMMSSGLPLTAYIKSKFMLFMAVSTFSFVLTSAYGLISWKIIAIQTAAYLYNIGVTSVIAVYFATYSYKGIDLTKSATFNYQGTGAAQWLYTLAVLLIPFVLYLPLAKWVSPWAGFIAIGAVGLISLLLQNWWITILTRELAKRKHLILQGFREK